MIKFENNKKEESDAPTVTDMNSQKRIRFETNNDEETDAPIDHDMELKERRKKMFKRLGTAHSLISKESNLCLSNERAEEIGKMDHHYLSFSDFLWCSWWVTLRLQIYVVKMYIKRRIYHFLGVVQVC